MCGLDVTSTINLVWIDMKIFDQRPLLSGKCVTWQCDYLKPGLYYVDDLI